MVFPPLDIAQTSLLFLSFGRQVAVLMYLSVSIACFALSLLISTVSSIIGTDLVSHFRFHFWPPGGTVLVCLW